MLKTIINNFFEFLEENIIVILFLLLLILFIIDIFGFDRILRNFFQPAIAYDIPFWNSIGNFLTFLTVLVAYFSLKQLRKQLKIEQEPYVVMTDGVNVDGIDNDNSQSKGVDYLKMKITNVGRGPAIRITVTSDQRNPDEAFFQSGQPHSADLASGQSKSEWKIDQENLRRILNIKGTDTSRMKNAIELFIHYFSQLEKREVTKVNLQHDRQSSFLKVMENKKLKDSYPS